MFGGKQNTKIDEYAKLMAGIVTDSVELKDDAIAYMTREQVAFLQGHRCIEHLNLGTFGSRRLITSFRDALIHAGLPKNEALVYMAKFWVFYWTMMVGSTDGAAKRFSLKQLRRSEAHLARIQ